MRIRVLPRYLSASILLALSVYFIPFLLPYEIRDVAIGLAMAVIAVWTVVTVVGALGTKGAARWWFLFSFLVGVPFVTYWPTLFVIWAHACAHNVSACP